MNRYKFTPEISVSNCLAKKLSVNTTYFFNLLNSGLTSQLVAVKTGVSARTVRRYRREMVQKIVATTDFKSWNC